jgi:hypothetical protein
VSSITPLLPPFCSPAPREQAIECFYRRLVSNEAALSELGLACEEERSGRGDALQVIDACGRTAADMDIAGAEHQSGCSSDRELMRPSRGKQDRNTYKVGGGFRLSV